MGRYPWFSSISLYGFTPLSSRFGDLHFTFGKLQMKTDLRKLEKANDQLDVIKWLCNWDTKSNPNDPGRNTSLGYALRSEKKEHWNMGSQIIGIKPSYSG